MENEVIRQKVNDWVESVVIKLQLCPFAKKPFNEGLMRVSICREIDVKNILEQLIFEIELIDKEGPESIETTLFVIPEGLSDFNDYLAFFNTANDSVLKLGYEGYFQIASFHPLYQFEGEELSDQSNFTNRSPYPIIHIIREDSLENAINYFGNVDSIPVRNMKLLRSMSRQEIQKTFPWYHLSE